MKVEQPLDINVVVVNRKEDRGRSAQSRPLYKQAATIHLPLFVNMFSVFLAAGPTGLLSPDAYRLVF
jgi:hypothetical protein